MFVGVFGRTDTNERQNKALNYLLEHGALTIKEYESICPEINRRTLQRELKQMIELGAIQGEGATNQLVYKLIL